MKESFTISETFKAEPEHIFEAWLSSSGHSSMTGGEAKCSKQVGDSFSTWDGYISGKNIELSENELIVQSWRTTEFDDADDDSIIRVSFNKVQEGTEIILTHTHIPEGQTQYKSGWKEHYFGPMKEFFDK